MKEKTRFVCSACGYETGRWSGKCPSCGGWNTLNEEAAPPPVATGRRTASEGRILFPTALPDIDTTSEIRFGTGISELDRVLGGGIVKGSLVLLAGEPGVGKSTLLLQICQHLSFSHRVLYVSGEESTRQIRLRADRLGVTSPKISLVSETDVASICRLIQTEKPDIAIIDSIQTMSVEGVSSAPGSVTQVKEATAAYLKCAKSDEIPILLVGHVNKDGVIAGPKVLEHAVDAVLSFEGDKTLSYRILRANKNRFGSTNEIGVFEMRDTGLFAVENPSEMLLSGRPENTSGSCVACVLEGSRPILAEVQALLSKTSFGTPRRMSTGFDYNRAAILIAVIEKRAGFFMGNLDAYINVVGGLRLDEPSADLPVALAMLSSIKDKPLGARVAAFGEIGLGGEIRAVTNADLRIREARRLGFSTCILPAACLSKLSPSDQRGIELIGVKNIGEACRLI